MNTLTNSNYEVGSFAYGGFIMPAIVSVALSYPNSSRGIFQLCAEFLRFMGIYVSEYCRLPQDDEDGCYSLEDETEVYIDLSKYPLQDISCAQGQNMVLDLLYRELQEYDFLGDFHDSFSTLKKIFVKCNLLSSAVTLQCFKVKDELILNTGINYKRAAEMLAEEIGDRPCQKELCYLYYAKLFAQQKANFSRYLCERFMAFSVNEMAEECLELISVCPQFSNARALFGLIYEKVSTKLGVTVDAYEDTLAEIGEKYYASSVYYWLGHRCEYTDTYGEKSKAAYKKAYELFPKYRNMFKMAMVCKAEGNIAGELQYLVECVKSIEKKGTYLYPLEQEYYFKTCVLIGYIYIYDEQLKDIAEGIWYIQKALDLKDNIQSEQDGRRVYTKFCVDIYGNAAKGYINLILNSMEQRRAHEYLKKAFTEIGMYDLAEKY